jgi:hypothetical protein
MIFEKLKIHGVLLGDKMDILELKLVIHVEFVKNRFRN